MAKYKVIGLKVGIDKVEREAYFRTDVDGTTIDALRSNAKAVAESLRGWRLYHIAPVPQEVEGMICPALPELRFIWRRQLDDCEDAADLEREAEVAVEELCGKLEASGIRFLHFPD